MATWVQRANRAARIRRMQIAIAVFGLGALMSVAPVSTAFSAPVTGWDFDDGTLQGWTLVSASTIGPTGYAALGKTATPPATTWDPLGYNSKSPAAGFAAAPTPFADRAAAQDAPIVLRSPTFQLFSGQIIAHLLGGIPQTNAVPPANFSVLSGASIDTGAAAGSDTSYQGLALRRNSDGAYLLHKARTSESSASTGWQQLTFTEAELAPVIAGNPGASYTLDLIDTAHGSFSSLNMDTISIPAPAVNALVSGGGQWQILKRNAASVTSLATADALLALPTGDPGITTEFQGVSTLVNIHGSGAAGHFAQDNAYVGGSADRFAMKVTGKINVLQAGNITFGFFSNDGARLRIDGALVAQDEFAGDLACDTFGTINLTAGLHDVELVMFETTGADTLELFVANSLGSFNSLNQGSFELLEAAVVPEPSSIVLIGFAMLMAGFAARRRA